MTRDELIRIALQCQLVIAGNRDGLYMDALAKFAELIAVAERRRTWLPEDWTDYERSIAENEREACAQLCEKADDDEFYFGRNYAEAIRARGNT